MQKNVRGPVCLMLCAVFWGMAFSAQSSAMESVEPYTFVFLRSAITCLSLALAMPLIHRMSPACAGKIASNRRHFAVGALCGTFLVGATILQQIGLVTTTTAKSGFITALYILIVPVLGVFLGRRPCATVWLGVAVSLAGLYFLCAQGTELSINAGDWFTLASAAVFAVHILLIDRLGGNLDSVKLSAIQFGAAAAIAGALTLAFETPRIEGILACWTDVLYVAVFSGALGYTLQIAGQKSTDPTLASLILCLESVFAALGGWLVLGETLSGREILGCALMLSASVIALMPSRRRAPL